MRLRGPTPKLHHRACAEDSLYIRELLRSHSTAFFDSDSENLRNMFYEGDLQSGIALAIQQVKRVVCFVRGKSGLTAPITSELGI